MVLTSRCSLCKVDEEIVDDLFFLLHKDKGDMELFLVLLWVYYFFE